jgi:7-carboxy-7-deazaguanine synthase
MSTEIRLSEVYLSVQGEGPRVGSRTVFVRSGGCNLRCPGWPCDTPHAIDPKLYRNEWTPTSPAEVVAQVSKIDPSAMANICFTGGEPFLQSSRAMYDTVQLLIEGGWTPCEVFTNGTIYFPDWSIDELYFIMDWKLPGSGEKLTELQERTRSDNLGRIGAVEGNAVKFTIADRNDYDCALETWRSALDEGPTLSFYYGVVWGKLEPATLIEWALADNLPWLYNHQIHNVIWNREERGI